MTAVADRIELVKADITTQRVDAIVNAANGNLRHGGGVARAIRLAAGDEPFQKHCYELIEKRGEPVPTGQAIASEPFELPCVKVIHAVGPVYGEHGGREPALLDSAYRSSIRLAVELGLRTLAFPAISCGIFGYPLEEATQTSIAAVIAALEENPEVELARFCFIGDQEKEAFERALAELAVTAGGDFSSEGFAPDTELPAERRRPAKRDPLTEEDYGG